MESRASYWRSIGRSQQRFDEFDSLGSDLLAPPAAVWRNPKPLIGKRPAEADSIDALSEGVNRVNLKTKAFVAVVILTQGCATLHNGRHQEIRVVTDPAGATVEVRCGKQQPAAVTPATVRLPRRVDQCSLILTRPGFHSETVVFDSSLSGWVWGNFAAPIAGAASGTTRQSDQAFVDFSFGALLGGAGFGVDALTGAMWQLEPAKVERKLAPK